MVGSELRVLCFAMNVRDGCALGFQQMTASKLKRREFPLEYVVMERRHFYRTSSYQGRASRGLGGMGDWEDFLMEQKALENLLAEWQKILRLQDWEVKIRFVRGHEIDDYQARIIHHDNHKQATVKLRDPIDWTSKDFPEDSELDLVHELIHLHTATFERKESEGSMGAEQAIELIARALVGLKRRADEQRDIG